MTHGSDFITSFDRTQRQKLFVIVEGTHLYRFRMNGNYLTDYVQQWHMVKKKKKKKTEKRGLTGSAQW